MRRPRAGTKEGMAVYLKSTELAELAAPSGTLGGRISWKVGVALQ